MSNVIWTPLMMKRLEKLIDNGMPYKVIAQTLSAEFNVVLTKNACIGKGRRLQVPLRIAPRKRQCQPRRKRRSPLSVERRRLLQSQRRRKESQQPRRNLTLLQLRPSSCRYPTGHNPPYSYCGAHTQDGSSYCPQHHAMTHYRSRS